MILKSKQKNGVSYFEVCVSCPKCQDRGIKVNPAFAIHKDCEGKIYVGDNGCYVCELCDCEAPVNYWEIECDCNNHSEFLVFKESKEPKSTILDHVTLAGQLVDTTGVRWLQKFLASIP